MSKIKEAEVIHVEARTSADIGKAAEALEHIVRSFDEKTTSIYSLCEVVVGNALERCYKNELEIIRQALEQKTIWKNIHNSNVRIPLCDIVNGRTYDERYKIVEDIYYNWEEKKEALEDKIALLEKENKELRENKSLAEKCWKIVKPFLEVNEYPDNQRPYWIFSHDFEGKSPLDTKYEFETLKEGLK